MAPPGLFYKQFFASSLEEATSRYEALVTKSKLADGSIGIVTAREGEGLACSRSTRGQSQHLEGSAAVSFLWVELELGSSMGPTKQKATRDMPLLLCRRAQGWRQQVHCQDIHRQEQAQPPGVH
jgi:hypothetical protein